jgi:Tfp pilus assembly protein PilE
MFEIITVVIVLGIFSLFALGAYKAEKVVAEKARLQREAQQKVKTASVKSPKNKK